MNQGRLPLEDQPRQPREGALRSFHAQHVHMTVEEAKAGEKRASRQEIAVLAHFRSLPAGTRLTPSELWKAMGGEAFWPVTSCRRALTNATQRGDLVHHKADRIEGPWGALESKWSLPEEG